MLAYLPVYLEAFWSNRSFCKFALLPVTMSLQIATKGTEKISVPFVALVVMSNLNEWLVRQHEADFIAGNRAGSGAPGRSGVPTTHEQHATDNHQYNQNNAYDF